MHAAEHDPVQRLERAGGAGHAQQQDAARAADLRLRPQFPARASCSPSRACRSRRLTAASSARSSSMSIPRRLSAKGLSQMDVVSALQTTNVIVPAGIARIGEREFNVKLNSSPQMVEQFQYLPVGVRDGVTVSLGDVAKVSDSFATQQKRRAHQRPARELHDHPEELGRFDDRRGRGDPRHAAGGSGRRRRRARAEARLRPVGVRAAARSTTSSRRRSCPRSWSR